MSKTPARSHPLIDYLYRQLFRAAYGIMRVFWYVFRPLTRGTNVALWHEGRLLVIRNSYRQDYTLPGGYIRFRESARAAAVREVREELQMTLDGLDLHEWGQIENRREFKRDRVTLFEVHCTTRPAIRIDNREVVAAYFLRPETAALNSEATLATYLAAKRVDGRRVPAAQYPIKGENHEKMRGGPEGGDALFLPDDE